MAGSGSSMINDVQTQTLQVGKDLEETTAAMHQHKEILEEKLQALLAAMGDSHQEAVQAAIAALQAAIAALEEAIAAVSGHAEDAKKIEARL